MSARILIVGAGIAGITAALALHARGLAHICLLERTAAFSGGGSGLNVLPLAVRELDELRLLKELCRQSVQLDRLEYSTHRGQLVWAEAKGQAAGFKWPQLSISRSVLQSVLLAHVKDRLGASAVLMATAVRSVHRNADGSISVTSESDRTFTVDIAIGADGIRSTLRPFVNPTFSGLRLAPATIYRGSCLAHPFRDDKTMIIAGNGQAKFVVYPMQAQANEGMSLINWAAAVPEQPTSSRSLGRWNVTVSSDEIAAHFSGWTLDGPCPADLIRRTAQTYAYPMVDIDPLPRWTDGSNLVLIGDAAHGMYPVGSNGATQSIVDAVSLAHFLSTMPTTAEAFAAYEQDCRPTVSALQLANRQKGPEVVVDLAALRAPQGFSSIHDVFEHSELEEIASRYARLARADIEHVNARSPYHRINQHQTSRAPS